MSELADLLATDLDAVLFESALRSAMDEEDIRLALTDLGEGEGGLQLEAAAKSARGELLSVLDSELERLRKIDGSWAEVAADIIDQETGKALLEARRNSPNYPSFQETQARARIAAQLAESDNADLKRLDEDRRNARVAIEAVLAQRLAELLRVETNRRMGDNYDASWSRDVAPGLRHSVIDAEFLSRPPIVTDGMLHLRAILSNIDGGSIGIAGPRGVDKSTILRWIADSRVDGQRTLSVIVAAPVKYDSREFLLDLFAETCIRSLSKELRTRTDIGSLLRLRSQALGYSERSMLTRVRERLLRQGAFDIGPILPAVFLVTSAALLSSSPRQWLTLAGACAFVASASRVDRCLLAVAVVAAWLCVVGARDTSAPIVLGLIGAAAIGLAKRWRERDDRSSYDDGTAVIARAAGIASLCASMIGSAFASVAAADGRGYLFGSLETDALLAAPSTREFVFVALAVASVIATTPAVRSLNARRQEARRYNERRAPNHELDILTELLEIRLQQTLKSAEEGSVALSVAKVFTAGAKGSSEETWSPHAIGYAELVGRYRRLLRRVAGRARIVIGIDELDKMDDPADLATFLNNLKGIFGVPGVLYMSTISLEAAAAFKRKGAPLREVFDSCFDEVVVLGPLSYADTRRVLNSRVVGMPRPFKALFYGLSGGVPREAIRLARRLQADQALADPVNLAQAARALVEADLRGRIEALQILGLVSDAGGLYELVEGIERALQSRGVGGWDEAARIAASCVENREIAEGAEGERVLAAARLGASVAVAHAILERFRDGLDEKELRALEQDGEYSAIDVLAQAVRQASVFPPRGLELARMFRTGRYSESVEGEVA